MVACQKTYNGVAIASRTPITDVAWGLDDGVEDPQARLIAPTVDGIRVICVYVPNGQTVGSDKYSTSCSGSIGWRATSTRTTIARSRWSSAATSTSRPKKMTSTTR